MGASCEALLECEGILRQLALHPSGEVVISECDATVFKEILEFYTHNKCCVTTDLYIAAGIFALPKLQAFCRNHYRSTSPELGTILDMLRYTEVRQSEEDFENEESCKSVWAFAMDNALELFGGSKSQLLAPFLEHKTPRFLDAMFESDTIQINELSLFRICTGLSPKKQAECARRVRLTVIDTPDLVNEVAPSGIYDHPQLIRALAFQADALSVDVDPHEMCLRGMHQELAVGDHVRATQDIVTMSSNKARLKKGSCGLIVKFDDDGDVLVDFPHQRSLLWVRAKRALGFTRIGPPHGSVG